MFEGTFQLSMALIGQKCISDLATFNTIRLKDSYLSLIQFDFFNFEKHFSLEYVVLGTSTNLNFSNLTMCS